MDLLIQSLPKAELHLHIEGTFEPDLMLKIATRNNVLDSLPFRDLAAAKAAYNFKNLQEFLDLYYIGCRVLLHEQDFHDLTWAYLKRAAADKVAYVEIMFDPQSHTTRGVPFAAVINGILSALTEAGPALGIQGNVIMNFLRHLGPEAALDTLAEAAHHKDSISAVGLDSTELGWPPSLWTTAYQEAGKQGYRLSAHAGEEGPADYVWQAIRDLGVERIDHGVHSIEDNELLDFLQKNRIPLTVCPISNLKLKVYEGKLVEQLKKLFSHGLHITINADDPAYFGGYENENYKWLVENLNLSAGEVYVLCCNGFQAAFLPEQQKKEYIAAVDAAFKKAMGEAAFKELSHSKA